MQILIYYTLEVHIVRTWATEFPAVPKDANL